MRATTCRLAKTIDGSPGRARLYSPSTPADDLEYLPTRTTGWALYRRIRR